ELDDGGRVFVAIAHEREREPPRFVIFPAQELHAERFSVEAQRLFEVVHANHRVQNPHLEKITPLPREGKRRRSPPLLQLSPHCCGTQTPLQSAPPAFGLQPSAGSSTHCIPCWHASPPTPPQRVGFWGRQMPPASGMRLKRQLYSPGQRCA